MRILAAASVAATIYACGEGGTEPTPPDPPRPARVVIAPGTLTFATLGETERLAAEVRDQDGRVMTGTQLTWLTRNATVAEVGSAGLVTAVGNGTTVVVAVTRLWELQEDAMRMVATAEVSDSVLITVDAPSFTLSGTVTDSRRPSLVLPGILVRLEGWKRTTTTTDADGRYSFPNLGGNLKVTAHAEFSYVSQAVGVTVDADLTRDFAMEHDGGTPFSSTSWISPTILGPDSTRLQGVNYAGRGVRTVYDRRREDWIRTNAFLFDALIGEQVVEFRVNSEFSGAEAARTEVDRFAPALGRLPSAFLSNVASVTINGGEGWWGGGMDPEQAGMILIHKQSSWDAIRRGFLEEIFVHEGTHASLDPAHARAVGWRAAQEADGVFISDYARNNPVREDLAESATMYFAVRYRPGSLTPRDRWAILTSIPNRLAYFEEQGFDMSPYVATGSLVPGLEPGSVASRFDRTVLPAPEAAAVASEISVTPREEGACEGELEDPAQPWTAWEYADQLFDGPCALPGLTKGCVRPGIAASRSGATRSMATRCVEPDSGDTSPTAGIPRTP